MTGETVLTGDGADFVFVEPLEIVGAGLTRWNSSSPLALTMLTHPAFVRPRCCPLAVMAISDISTMLPGV